MRIIDFHTHLDDRWFDAPLLTQKQFVAGLDQCGVETACVFTLMGFYEDCRKHNDLLARRASTDPKRLLPFITVDPKLGNPAIEEMERCLELGMFRGVKFHPWIQAFAPSMVKPTMIELLKRAAAAKLPVIFHDGTPPYSTTFQIAMCARWAPEANIVLGHAGLADYTTAAARLCKEIPNLYACVCGPRTADIRHIVEIAGAEKVLFGSDFGLSDALVLRDRIDSVLHAGLSEQQRDQILWRTAAQLLRISD
jgi:uncharacterized protein